MADDTRGLYASVDLGIGMLDSQTLEYDDGTNVSSSKVDFDASFAGGATIGYRLNDRWAIELAIVTEIDRARTRAKLDAHAV